MQKKTDIRIEKDTMGMVEVPKDALYGAQTQRAIENFPMSDLRLPKPFIRALALIKGACAKANADLKRLDPNIAKAILDAADSIAQGQYAKEFPLDVFQTGSGTSSNMNANEVIANLASLRSRLTIHPNDHVNMSQSSNDVIPSAIHLSASLELHSHLFPAFLQLEKALEKKQKELQNITKTGRTHLMDAVPITFGQEISGWASQVHHAIIRLEGTLPRIRTLSMGGTAIGTGMNAHPEFGHRVAVLLSEKTGYAFSPHSNLFESISSQDSMVELSGQLKACAVTLSKIANDLRLMNSGPLTGFNEIILPAIQPGSSIMPGKVNPVIAESVLMACAQVIGNDTAITLSGLGSNFQLNTMLPLIAYNILQSILLLGNSAKILADKAILGFVVNEQHIREKLSLNPILVTALNPIIGYEKAAEIAKRAYQEKKPICKVAEEMTDLSRQELERLLDPKKLTEGGL